MTPTLWIATRKGLFNARQIDGDWRLATEAAFLGEPVSILLPDPRDGALYAALRLGHFGCKLHRSRDGGVTWEEIATPAYPPKPEGHADATEWKLDTVWSLEAGGADQPGRLWAGTIPGGLFRSDNFGASWQLVESLWNVPERLQWFGGGYDFPGIHSICVDPRDSRCVLVAVSCGGVWLTQDDGASWQLLGEGLSADYLPPERIGDAAVQDPHRVQRCAGQPDQLWMQHHSGVFRSGDGGRSWRAVTDIAPSAFGFAVAVHPQDAEQVWLVPAMADAQRVPVNATLAVNRSTDGGAHWHAVWDGLPSPAWDLVYRHGLAIDDSGQLLGMGSTTGGLWLSADAGNLWQTLSTQLPPIYAVRWAA